MGTVVQSQIDLTASGAQSWSDFEDARSLYKKRLDGGIEIEVAIPEAGSGLQPRKQVSVRVESVAVNSSELTLADLTMTPPGIDGAAVTAKLQDLDAGTTLLRLNGTVRQVDEVQGTFVVEEVEASMLAQLLPKRRILDLFVNADIARAGTDPRVIWVFKEMRQVLLVKCQAFGGAGADWGAFRIPAAGVLTLVTVYVNKAVAPAANYSFVNTGTVFVVRFPRIPVGADGQEAEIRVDITSTEYTRPSDVGKAILNDSTDGLNKGVNNASFTAAAAVFATAGYSAGGGIGTEPLTAGDILKLLCLRGSVIGKNNAGSYTWTVDEAALHTAVQYNGRPYGLGRGDGHWENIVKVLTKSQKPIESRINDFTVQGLRTEGFGKEAYLISARSTRAVNGTPLLQTNRFVGDLTTLSAEVGYGMARMAAEEYALGLDMDNEVKMIALNNTVPVTVPYLRLSSTNPPLPWIVQRIVGRTENWTLGLVGYDSTQYAATAGTTQAAAAASYLTDYRFTIPGTPTSFAIVGTPTLRLSGNGSYQVELTLTADAPAVNVSRLSFRARIPGSILWASETNVDCVPGATGVQGMLLDLRPGLTYDLACFAQNVKNDPDFQTSGGALLLSQLMPNNPTAFAVPATPVLSQGTGKSLQGVWTANSEKGVTYNIYLDTNNPPTTLVASNVKGNSFAYAPSTLAYASTYRMRVSSVNPSGVESTLSATSGAVTLTKVSLIDPGGDITGILPNNHLNIPWGTADIGNATITDAKIANLSAVKITTGLLTVNPSSGGATGIQVNNAGQVVMRASSASPGANSTIRFENASAVTMARIAMTSGGAMWVYPEASDTFDLNLGGSGERWNNFNLYGKTTTLNGEIINLSTTGNSGTVILGRFTPGITSSSAVTPANVNGRVAVYSGGALYGYLPTYAAL